MYKLNKAVSFFKKGGWGSAIVVDDWKYTL